MNSDPTLNTPVLALHDGINTVQAAAGEVILLMGEVGSGKTCWLEQIAGLIKPSSHLSVTINGQPSGGDLGSVRMLFDRQPVLWLGHSISEELCFGLKKQPSIEKILGALANWRLAQLEPAGSVSDLNRLEAARLMLASSSLTTPALLLLDNPTDSLPEADALSLRDDIAVWAEQSNTTVVVACNRWHDWLPVATQVWRILAPDHLPQREAQA